MKEIWKPVPGFDGYEASSLGNIRSVYRLVTYGPSILFPFGYKRWMKGRVLRPAPNRSGHLMVVPGRAAGSVNVHQMVALAFIGPPPKGREVIHRDECKTNNKPRNLKYGTRSENLHRCYLAGNR
jgi:hypothetical protein